MRQQGRAQLAQLLSLRLHPKTKARRPVQDRDRARALRPLFSALDFEFL
jgi:hypothetical protein